MVGYAPSVGRKTISTGERVDLLEVGGRGERKLESIRGGKVGDQQPRASYQIRAIGGGILAGLTRATPTGPVRFSQTCADKFDWIEFGQKQ